MNKGVQREIQCLNVGLVYFSILFQFKCMIVIIKEFFLLFQVNEMATSSNTNDNIDVINERKCNPNMLLRKLSLLNDNLLEITGKTPN